jgi:hypothetical protein
MYWDGLYVMVAHDDRRGPVVTLVSEGGRQWTRSGVSTTDGKPTAAVSDGDLFAVVGESFSNDGLFLYGGHPNELVTAEPLPRIDTGKVPIGVEARDGGFVSIVNQKSDAVIFTSESGDMWTEVARFEEAEFASIASFDGGYVAVGQNTRPDQPAVWRSSNGSSWVKVDAPTDREDVRLDLIRGQGNRLVLVGYPNDDDAALLWWSEDGLKWETMSSIPDTLVRDVMIRGDMVITAGVDRILESAAIWAWAPGGDWARAPHDDVLFQVR